jgi:hypothetical protein
MYTQRDQVQAQQFMRRRVATALQQAEANSQVWPGRRLLLCYAAGIACALLIVAGFAIYGILRPGR